MMKGESPPIEPLARVIIRDARHVCEICDNRVILGEENWKKHLRSRSHKWHIKLEARSRHQNSGVVS